MLFTDEEDFLDAEEASILGKCAKSVPTTRKKKALHRCRAWYYWWRAVYYRTTRYWNQ